MEDKQKNYLINLKAKLHKAEDNIAYFAEEFVSNDITSKRIPDFHREIYSLIAQLKGFNVVVAPRGHAKSTLCSVIFPLWCAMYGKRKTIKLVSASQNLAVAMMRKIKMELETNPLFKAIGWQYRTTKWSEAETHLKSLKGDIIEIQAVGAGGQIRGLRPDLIIMDDIEEDEGVRSIEQRRKLQEWLNKAVIGTLLPEGQIVMIGTILHHDSLLQNILDNPLGWSTLFYQAYHNAEQTPENVLWKEQFSHEQLQERKKTQGSWAFASEYLNLPISPDDAPFKPADVRYYKELPDKYSMVVALDPAYTEGNQSDYKVAVCIARDHENNRYLAEYVCTRLPMADYMQAAYNLIMKYKNKITTVGLPTGREVDFKNKFIEFCGQKGQYFNYKDLKNTTGVSGHLSARGKEARVIASLQGLFQQGKYYLKLGHDMAIDQLASFPRGKHDDIPDAMSYAEQIILPVYFDEDYDGDYAPETTPNFGAFGYGED